ncbi:MAG TPA: hypothetical protein VEF06_04150 [Bryobacteraceae bacterium]|nr:hypothetical protein [Bryobacteraceae bacterium]
MKTLLPGFALALVSVSASGAEMTGYISDTKCATDHAKSATAAEWIHPKVFETCAVQCVKQEGSTPIFLTSDNKVLKMDAASVEKAMPHLGHKVKVEAKVTGDTIRIESISTVAWQ